MALNQINYGDSFSAEVSPVQLGCTRNKLLAFVAGVSVQKQGQFNSDVLFRYGC